MAYMIWIAQHPEDSTIYEVSLTEPEMDGVLLGGPDGDLKFVGWKEYVALECRMFADQ